MMEKNPISANKTKVFGDGMTNKLPSVSRKRRKRELSKLRRTILRKEANESLEVESSQGD